ncbi:MAG: DUF547 domain-containing protein [Flavobacteriaceae bacterium]
MPRIILISILISLFTISVNNAQTPSSYFEATDAFLKKYVSKGKVDYAAICKNPEDLNTLLQQAKNISVSKNEAATYQAFWINTYNLAVIKGIVDNYPIKSPLDKSGFFDRITYEVGGSKITLNDIENKKLRVVIGDARVHFVLVCGAKGCPPLIAEAYTPERLESQLQNQTSKALNSSFIKVEDKKVLLSEIFKWYKEDFVKNGNEIDFINQFRKEKIDPNLKIDYYSYNWQLNSNH